MPTALVSALEKERDRATLVGINEKIRRRTLDEVIKVARHHVHSVDELVESLERERDRTVYIGSREKIRRDAIDSAIKVVIATSATTTARPTLTALDDQLDDALAHLRALTKDLKRDAPRRRTTL